MDSGGLCSPDIPDVVVTVFLFLADMNRKTKVKVLLTGSADMAEGFTIFPNESNTNNFN